MLILHIYDFWEPIRYLRVGQSTGRERFAAWHFHRRVSYGYCAPSDNRVWAAYYTWQQL